MRDPKCCEATDFAQTGWCGQEFVDHTTPSGFASSIHVANSPPLLRRGIRSMRVLFHLQGVLSAAFTALPALATLRSWRGISFSALAFEVLDDGVIAETTGGIESGAPVSIGDVDVHAGLHGDLHSFKRQCFFLITVDCNPFAAPTHAYCSHQYGCVVDAVTKDIFRGAAVRNVIGAKNELRIRAML